MEQKDVVVESLHARFSGFLEFSGVTEIVDGENGGGSGQTVGEERLESAEWKKTCQADPAKYRGVSTSIHSQPLGGAT